MSEFSIITVTLNNLEGLKKTYASLCPQSMQDFEWIVVDGGSNDGTGEWLADNHTSITWWQSKPDNGLYDAMNIGLKQAKGDYVLFLNAGDALADHHTLLTILADIRAATSKPDFVYGDSYETTPNGNMVLKPAYSHKKKWYGLFTHHQAMLYRRASIKDLRYDQEAYPISADYHFTVKFLKHYSQSVLRISKPLCIFEHGGISQTKAHQGRREIYTIRKNVWEMGFLSNNLIYWAQMGLLFTRNRLPFLYRMIRFRKA